MFEKDLDRAKSEADVALSLNPNSSGAYASLGSIHTYQDARWKRFRRSSVPLVSIPPLGLDICTSSAWRTCLQASTKQQRLC